MLGSSNIGAHGISMSAGVCTGTPTATIQTRRTPPSRLYLRRTRSEDNAHAGTDRNARALARLHGGDGLDRQGTVTWGLWTAAQGSKKETAVCQSTLPLILDERRMHDVSVKMKGRQRGDFGRKAWMQSDGSSSAWVISCSKEHNRFNAKQFPVVAQL